MNFTLWPVKQTGFYCYEAQADENPQVLSIFFSRQCVPVSSVLSTDDCSKNRTKDNFPRKTYRFLWVLSKWGKVASISTDSVAEVVDGDKQGNSEKL